MPEVVVRWCDGSCGHGRRHVHLPTYWNLRLGAEAGLKPEFALVEVPSSDCIDGVPSLAQVRTRLRGTRWDRNNAELAEVVTDEASALAGAPPRWWPFGGA